MFGLDPSTGKLRMEDQQKHKHHKHGKEEDHTHTHGHGPHEDPGLGHEHKKKETDDNTLGYFNSADTGAGGGGSGSSKTEDAKKETKQEKTDRILQRSFLFYQEDVPHKDGMLGKKKGDEDLKGATSVSGDGTSFDSNHVKLFIEDVTNLLFGMQEPEIASWYKTTALECINNLEGTTEEKEEKVCLSEKGDERLKILRSTRKIYYNNLLHRYCPNAKTKVNVGSN